jgi:hypothetical protein
MRVVLAHPLGPLPWSLATADGSLRKTNKYVLAKELQKNMSSADASNIVEPSAYIIDGMNIVQKLGGDQKTFAEVAQCILSIILNKCSSTLGIFPVKTAH